MTTHTARLPSLGAAIKVDPLDHRRRTALVKPRRRAAAHAFILNRVDHAVPQILGIGLSHRSGLRNARGRNQQNTALGIPTRFTPLSARSKVSLPSLFRKM